MPAVISARPTEEAETKPFVDEIQATPGPGNLVDEVTESRVNQSSLPNESSSLTDVPVDSITASAEQSAPVVGYQSVGPMSETIGPIIGIIGEFAKYFRLLKLLVHTLEHSLEAPGGVLLGTRTLVYKARRYIFHSQF